MPDIESPRMCGAQLQKRDVESLLLDGKLDVLIATNVPRSYRAGDPRIRRVFRDITRYTFQSLYTDDIAPIHNVFRRLFFLVVRNIPFREFPPLKI